MRVQHLELLRYGHFTNASIALPAGTPDMQMVLGDIGSSPTIRMVLMDVHGIDFSLNPRRGNRAGE